MNVPQPNFASARKDHRRLLQVMTKNSAFDVVPSDDGTKVFYVGEAYTAANTALLLAEAVRIGRKSPASKHVLAKDVSRAILDGRLSAKDATVARKLRQYLKIAVGIDTETFKVYFPEHRFHPDIQVGIAAIELIDRDAGHLSTEERMLALLRAIRVIGLQAKFVEERSRFRKASSKRLRATKDYINGIFKKCKRQLSVRVDLGYGLQGSYSGQGTVRSGLTFSSVNKHRERLETALKKSFRGFLSGYEIRLEWAPHKSFHFHLLVLLNGYKVQNRTFYARRIGALWAKASRGLGTHWEPEPHEGETRGTGMIHGDRPDELAGLIKAATYLCKEGYYIDYYKGEKDRTFFRSKLD